MSMLKKPQTVEAVVFFNERGICKQMLYSEFEAILDGVVGLPEFADCQMRLTYLMITPRLQVRAAVFFYLDFDEEGRADTGWNLPLRQLADAADGLVAGNYDQRLTVQAMTGNEFGAVARALSEASQRLARGERQLRSTSQTQATVLEGMSESVIAVDRGEHVLFANASAGRLLGFRPEKVEGLPLLEAVKKTGTPLVVVLINSKPLCIPWVAEHADAIIEAFNPGMMGGEAIAEILFGEANPTGKLTVSFPAHVGQQPVHYQQIPGWHGNKHTGYTNKPLFAFGYGLSYTTYSYEKLELSATQIAPGQSIGVEVTVQNTGGRAGTEIVQLYLNDVFTSLSTPEKTLKRYARVHLDRGQSQVVRFELGPEDLTFIGRDNQPISEPGEFEVMVGSSSRNEDLLRARFTLLG